MSPKPFLRWVGGKTQLLPQLLAKVPESFGTYYEPFLGGGALFWALAAAGRIHTAVLADSNLDLVRAYQWVREDVTSLIQALQPYTSLLSEQDYYRIRAMGGDIGEPDVCKAARTIYLNKTCFNGLYRVNKAGKFNVPYGHRKNPQVLDVPNLLACSEVLKNVEIYHCDWQEAIQGATGGDFVYFDPPYIPLKADSFTAYTADGFELQDQVDLHDTALRLKQQGVHVLLSNSGAPLVHDLYHENFTLTEVAARRNVNSDGSGRGSVKEYLIT